MEISRTTAMKIVEDLSNIISYQINLMNESGIIIASTDKERIGTYHAGSLKILSEHLEQLIIHKDNEHKGAKKGLNLPIEVDGQYIGVIGITGEYKEVEKYGHIIKRMTEILVLDDEQKEHKRLEKSAKSRFVREWINGTNTEGASFLQQAAAYDIDLKLPRRILVLSEDGKFEMNSRENLKHIEVLEKTINDFVSEEKGYLFLSNGKKYILMIPEKENKIIVELCSNLQKAIYRSSNTFLYFGVDSETADVNAMREAYLRADKAMIYAMRTQSRQPVFYSDLKLEIFIHEIPQVLRREYVKKLYKGYSEEEIRQVSMMLNIFYDCNGSINKASEQLYIHKNTLQYKLNRLAERTGVNPRTYQGAALFYMANEFIEIENGYV